MSTPLRIVFAGTPAFASGHLDALIQSEHDVIAVYSQPDRPAGRGKKLTASPVKQLAQTHQIPVYQPTNFKQEDDLATLEALNADIMVVVAYGLLLPERVLNAPKHGCLNVHGSILPRWRGAAPIQRAIEAGDTESGVTIMQMDRGLDTGDMLLKAGCPINPTDSSSQLHDTLLALGPPALLTVLTHVQEGTLSPEKQDDGLANYAHKIDKSEAALNWQENGEQIIRKIHAFNPFPVCFTTLNGARLKIYDAEFMACQPSGSEGQIHFDASKKSLMVACNNGYIIIKTLQLAGKKAMPVDVFVNGFLDLLKTDAGQFHTLGQQPTGEQ